MVENLEEIPGHNYIPVAHSHRIGAVSIGFHATVSS